MEKVGMADAQAWGGPTSAQVLAAVVLLAPMAQNRKSKKRFRIHTEVVLKTY